jgi:hypothetical protein
MTDAQATTTPPIQFERTEQYIASYANSIIFESSAWDLKLIFGQLDQVSSTTLVKQHLAVTIPWPQAKLALFWLRLQIEVAEIQVRAKIPIRQEFLPPELPPLTSEQENDPGTKEFYGLYHKIREEFLASL